MAFCSVAFVRTAFEVSPIITHTGAQPSTPLVDCLADDTQLIISDQIVLQSGAAYRSHFDRNFFYQVKVLNYTINVKSLNRFSENWRDFGPMTRRKRSLAADVAVCILMRRYSFYKVHAKRDVVGCVMFFQIPQGTYVFYKN